MNAHKKAQIQLNIAVVLFGLTAILGDLIAISAMMIVWWRVLITSASLLLVGSAFNAIRQFSRTQILTFLGIGVLIAIHWLTFYGAVKLANASLTLICLSTTAFFTAFIEPLFFKKKVRWIDVMLGVAIIPCMWLIVDGVDSVYYLGLAVGLVSAFFASLFGTINKKYVSEVDVFGMTMVEMIGVFLIISLIIPFVWSTTEQFAFLPPSGMDWVYLVILSLVCTTIAWVLSMFALRGLSVFEANLVINLEPIYGIAMAAFFLKEYEQLSPKFYIGAVLMVILVLIYPAIRRRTTPPMIKHSDMV